MTNMNTFNDNKVGAASSRYDSFASFKEALENGRLTKEDFMRAREMAEFLKIIKDEQFQADGNNSGNNGNNFGNNSGNGGNSNSSGGSVAGGSYNSPTPDFFTGFSSLVEKENTLNSHIEGLIRKGFEELYERLSDKVSKAMLMHSEHIADKFSGRFDAELDFQQFLKDIDKLTGRNPVGNYDLMKKLEGLESKMTSLAGEVSAVSSKVEDIEKVEKATSYVVNEFEDDDATYLHDKFSPFTLSTEDAFDLPGSFSSSGGGGKSPAGPKTKSFKENQEVLLNGALNDMAKGVNVKERAKQAKIDLDDISKNSPEEIHNIVKEVIHDLRLHPSGAFDLDNVTRVYDEACRRVFFTTDKNLVREITTQVMDDFGVKGRI